MAALSFNNHAQAGGRGNVCHQADVYAFLLEQRTLFDMELDELVELPFRHRYRFECPLESSCGSQLIQPASPLSRSVRACAGVSTLAIIRLPRHPMPNRVGSSAVKITSSMERRGLNPSC